MAANVAAAQTTGVDRMGASLYGPYVFDVNNRTWTVQPQKRGQAVALQKRSYVVQPQHRTLVIKATP